ncbi:MAG: hypothetical protein HGGPFJEG_00065 [Ignavibacteria bacterium]|nr:hypothetical protein [Ignavibacteria bacterium]
MDMNGIFFHIYNRGNNHEKIFIEEKNYIYFINKFAKYLHDFIDIYCYSLLPRHFHFVVKIKDIETNFYEFFDIPTDSCKQLSPIEKAFRDFFISYSKSINKIYGRNGSLFQSKYKRNLIETEAELKRLIAYIHTNPVRIGLCNKIEDWNYSSYNSILQYKNVSDLSKEIIKLFGDEDSFVKFHENYSEPWQETELLFRDYYTGKIPRLSEYIRKVYNV